MELAIVYKFAISILVIGLFIPIPMNFSGKAILNLRCNSTGSELKAFISANGNFLFLNYLNSSFVQATSHYNCAYFKEKGFGGLVLEALERAKGLKCTAVSTMDFPFKGKLLKARVIDCVGTAPNGLNVSVAMLLNDSYGPLAATISFGSVKSPNLRVNATAYLELTDFVESK